MQEREKKLSERKGHSRGNSRNSRAFLELHSRPKSYGYPVLGGILGATPGCIMRGKTLGHSDFRGVLSESKFRTEFPLFSWEERPEFRSKRYLYEPLLTAMSQVLPSPIASQNFSLNLSELVFQIKVVPTPQLHCNLKESNNALHQFSGILPTALWLQAVKKRLSFSDSPF